MYYFAYGSNLNREQISELCPGCKPKFRATLPNYKLIFAGWSRKWHGGTASIKRAQDEKVLGALYEISERDLKALDKFEGCPDIYERVRIKVITERDEITEATTYIMRIQSEETKPSQEYLEVIRQGYKDWKIH